MIIIILLNQSIALIRDCTLYSATNWILNIQQMRAEVSKYSKFLFIVINKGHDTKIETIK